MIALEALCAVVVVEGHQLLTLVDILQFRIPSLDIVEREHERSEHPGRHNALGTSIQLSARPKRDSTHNLFVCLFVGFATLIGVVAGNADFGFVVGLGSACGLGAHQLAVRHD